MELVKTNGSLGNIVNDINARAVNIGDLSPITAISPGLIEYRQGMNELLLRKASNQLKLLESGTITNLITDPQSKDSWRAIISLLNSSELLKYTWDNISYLGKVDDIATKALNDVAGFIKEGVAWVKPSRLGMILLGGGVLGALAYEKVKQNIPEGTLNLLDSFAWGMFNRAIDWGKGIGALVTDPLGRLQGMNEILCNPENTINHVLKAGEKTVNDIVINGSGAERAELAGKVVFDTSIVIAKVEKYKSQKSWKN